MSYIDTYKRGVLLESAMSKFFNLFDEGNSDEEIIRLFAEQGIVVPEQFVGKASFAALSNNEVLTSLFPDNPSGGLKHVNLAFELDAIIIAPATSNIICNKVTINGQISQGKQ